MPPNGAIPPKPAVDWSDRAIVDHLTAPQSPSVASPRIGPLWPESGLEPVLQSGDGDAARPDEPAQDIGDRGVRNPGALFDLPEREPVDGPAEAAREDLDGHCFGAVFQHAVGPIPRHKAVNRFPFRTSHNPTLIGVDSSPDGITLPYASKVFDSKRQSPGRWQLGHTDEVAAFIAKIVATVEPFTRYSRKDLLWAVADFVEFIDRTGRPLTDEIFAADNVNRYARAGVGHLNRGSVRTQMAILRRVSEVMDEASRPPFLPIHADPCVPHAPYTVDEQVALWHAGQNLRTYWLGHNMLTVLALGFGTGARTNEIFDIHPGDVHDNGGLVTLGDREVPVLAGFERTLDHAALVCRDLNLGWLVFPYRTVTGKNLLSNFVKSARLEPSVPHLSASRLRVTWIVHHLSLATPITVLKQAAGVESIGAFNRYLPFVEPPSPDEAYWHLRGRPTS